MTAVSAGAGPGSEDTLTELAEIAPLSHPLIASISLFDFEQAPPGHLREIYGAVYRALSDNPEYARAPKNIARFFPREHGKSEVGSVVIPVWLALKNPNIRILIMSETESQAKGKLRECRDHIREVGERFDREIIEDNKTEITLDRTATWDVPTIKAAGFSTGITGGHFDVIVFDDLVSWETQRTESRREKTWNQFQDYLNLGSRGETVNIVIGTRKHPDDLYSHLIEGPAWDAEVLPAISDWSIVENDQFDVVTDAGARYNAADIDQINPTEETIVATEPKRDVDVLWPDRWPLDALLLDLVTGYGQEQGTLIWQREMQNNPAALQGQILSEEMISWVDELPKRKGQYTWVAGLDPAVEDDPEKAATNDTDYWAIAVGAYDRVTDETFIVDIDRRRGMTMAQGLQWAQSNLQPYQISECLVEDAQAQRWFVQTGKDEGLPLRQSKSTGKKEKRIISMSPRFENGKVKIVSPAPGNSKKWQSFLNEWASFPAASHDDRLDATEILLRSVYDDETRNQSGFIISR